MSTCLYEEQGGERSSLYGGAGIFCIIRRLGLISEHIVQRLSQLFHFLCVTASLPMHFIYVLIHSISMIFM